jgi:membrane-bound lytic murein transglycosylase D
VPDKTRQEEPAESPESRPGNNLFVENPMVAYRPSRQGEIQPPIATADLVFDDAEVNREAEASPAVPVEEAKGEATARLADNQQVNDMSAEDAGPLSEPSPPARETSDPAVSRAMQTRPATPGIKSPHNSPEVVLANLVVKKTWIRKGKPVGIIRVDVEETLGHYAEWLGVAARDIRRLNGMRYGRALQLNQKLKIPLHRVTQEEFVEKRFEYHQELAEDFFASYRVEKIRTYSIKRGDNIWTLSHQEFEVPLWLIKRYNAGVDFSSLVPAQKLVIPIIEKNV